MYNLIIRIVEQSKIWYFIVFAFSTLYTQSLDSSLAAALVTSLICLQRDTGTSHNRRNWKKNVNIKRKGRVLFLKDESEQAASQRFVVYSTDPQEFLPNGLYSIDEQIHL